MGKYNIKIYSHAKKDLKDIISYLNTLSPQTIYLSAQDLRRLIGVLS
jgi:hypothetical protein